MACTPTALAQRERSRDDTRTASTSVPRTVATTPGKLASWSAADLGRIESSYPARRVEARDGERISREIVMGAGETPSAARGWSLGWIYLL